MSTLIFHGHYIASADGTGKTGLTVTIDLWRVPKDGTSPSEIVTAGSASETGDGWYRYRLTSADLSTYDYVATMKTSDTTVRDKHVAAGWTRFAEEVGDKTGYSIATGGIAAAAFAAGAVDAAALAADAANEIADALLDRTSGVETSYTLRYALRVILAAMAGRVSGGGTGTVVIKDINNSKTRITATCDTDGNRSSVTVDAT